MSESITRFGILCLVLFALLAYVLINVNCAARQVTLEDLLQQKFVCFTTAVAEAYKYHNLKDTPNVKLVDRTHVHDNAMVSGYYLRDPYTYEFLERGIEIAKGFLVQPDIVLAHVANHEVCHFHLADTGQNPNDEMLTERCVFEMEGPKVFLEVYKILHKQEGYPAPELDQLKKAMGIVAKEEGLIE